MMMVVFLAVATTEAGVAVHASFMERVKALLWKGERKIYEGRVLAKIVIVNNTPTSVLFKRSL